MGGFALRSELGCVWGCSRIARHDALYGASASASAQSIETNGASLINPTDFEEIPAVDTTKAAGDIKRNRIQGFDGPTMAYSGNVNRPHLLNK